MSKKTVVAKPAVESKSGVFISDVTIYGTAPTTKHDSVNVSSMCEALIVMAEALKEIAYSAKRPNQSLHTGISISNVGTDGGE